MKPGGIVASRAESISTAEELVGGLAIGAFVDLLIGASIMRGR